METCIIEPPSLDPDSLKSRFKERCASTGNVHQNWQIRVHRSLSWFKRSIQFSDDQPEARFLFLWIALNSLYSQWNAERNAPEADSHARDAFIQTFCAMNPALICATMQKHRGLASKILSNPYLSDVFWREPDHPKAKGWATEDSNYLARNYKSGDYCRVLRQVTGRLFVLRGQIVHGASTGGSQLNRPSLRYCLTFLSILVPIIQHIVIEHGASDDWPELCYPPVG